MTSALVPYRLPANMVPVYYAGGEEYRPLPPHGFDAAAAGGLDRFDDGAA